MTSKELKTDTIKIAKLIEFIKNGQWKIPSFQREYVWARKVQKVIDLLDSLDKQFPISAILLWDSDDESIHSTEGKKFANTTWVIDGQQRSRTLELVSDGEIAVSFKPSGDEKGRKFVLATDSRGNPKKDITEENGWYPVSKILDSSAVHFDEFVESENQKIKEDLRRLRRTILDYDMPVILMKGYSKEEIITTFDRVNTKGTPLKPADIYNSDIAAIYGSLSPKIKKFLSQLHEKGFSSINLRHLLVACECIASPDCDPRKRPRLNELPNLKTVEKAWSATEFAAHMICEKFMREEFGIVDMKSIFVSGPLLVPAIVLCDRWSKHPANKNYGGLAAWIALAAFHRRYSSSSNTALEDDLRACYAADPIKALLQNIRAKMPNLKVSPKGLMVRSHDMGILFAAYLACRHKGWRDVFTEKQLTSYVDIDRHHIFPRAKASEDDKKSFDIIANIAFVKQSDIAESKHRKSQDDSPSVYLQGKKPITLESNCIPNDSELWKHPDREKFWEERRKLLAAAFNEYITEKLGKKTW